MVKDIAQASNPTMNCLLFLFTCTITIFVFSNSVLARQGTLNQDQRFLLAARSLAVQNSVRINKIETEAQETTSNTLSQSSWRVSATGEAASIIQWTNNLLLDFQSCGMRQLELKRAGANVKDFDASMTWVCIELKDK